MRIREERYVVESKEGRKAVCFFFHFILTASARLVERDGICLLGVAIIDSATDLGTAA